MQDNNNNQRKFYVTDEVLEILFEFLKKKTTKQQNKETITKSNIGWLQQEINDRTINPSTKKAKNKDNTSHTEEYFKTIKEKINKLSKFANKEFEKLNKDEQRALAEFLYQLEDLAEDNKFYPELATKQNNCHQSSSVITQLHIIKTLALPVLENCTYKYDKKNNQTNIHLVQDFNFLQKSSSAYKFYNFYPFNDITKFNTKEEAVQFHYQQMATNYFTYLKALIDNNQDTFFVCYKPGVCYFAANKITDNENIQKIFKEAFNKLDDKYKECIKFCMGDKDIQTNKQNGFNYNYTVEKLKEEYNNSNDDGLKLKYNFLSKNKLKIQYVNGVARDPWVKIGNEARPKDDCLHVKQNRYSTDAMFGAYSDEFKSLYGGTITKGKQTSNNSGIQNLTAQPAEIKITSKMETEDQTKTRYQLFIENMLNNKNNKGLNENYKYTLKQHIKATIQPIEAIFYYTEKERKQNALLEYANGNIANLEALNKAIQGIHGGKCSWCCGNY